MNRDRASIRGCVRAESYLEIAIVIMAMGIAAHRKRPFLEPERFHQTVVEVPRALKSRDTQINMIDAENLGRYGSALCVIFQFAMSSSAQELSQRRQRGRLGQPWSVTHSGNFHGADSGTSRNHLRDRAREQRLLAVLSDGAGCVFSVAVPLAVSVAAKIQRERVMRPREMWRYVVEAMRISRQTVHEEQSRFAFLSEVSVMKLQPIDLNKFVFQHLPSTQVRISCAPTNRNAWDVYRAGRDETR